MAQTSRNIALGLLVWLGCSPWVLAATQGVLTVSSTGVPISGPGNITVAFNDSTGKPYTETVAYGVGTSPAALASGLAAMFTRDYICVAVHNCTAGLGAHSNGAIITFQLNNSTTFGSLPITTPSASFSVVPSQWPTPTSSSGVVTCSPSVSYVNSNVTCSVSLASGATGIVSYSLDGQPIATAPLDSFGLASAILSLSSASAGAHSVTYSYAGDANDPAASASTSITVVQTGSALPNESLVYSFSIGSFEANGNVTSSTDTVNGFWSNIQYDALNRLTSAQVAPGMAGNLITNLCWTYDSFGNRTSQILSNQPFASGGNPCQPQSGAVHYDQQAQYNSANRVSSGTSGTPVYDASGEVTNDLQNQYLYDAEGRVCAVVGPPIAGITAMTGYLYDAEGRRVAKGVISTATCDLAVNNFTVTSEYVVGPGGEQVAEYDGDNHWVHTNVYAGGQMIATYDTANRGTAASPTVHYQFTDWLGTRRAQVTASGTIEETCQSLPFGDQLTCSQSPQVPTADDATEHHFTGKERDAESGLDYFGARYYGSSMGRFMSPDPIKITEDRVANPSTLNLYSYAANNPLKYVDPDGQDITYFYDQGGIAGHAVIFAYNQQTGDGAIESFGPIVHSPIAAGESMFDLGPNVTADKLRQTYAALTIQASPELTQQVIDYIRANPDPNNWMAFGPNCSTQCSKILQKFKLEMSRNKGKRPKVLWDALRQQYNPNAPAKPTGGLDYGAPRIDMFGAFWNQIQQNWKDDPVEGTPKRNTAPPCLKSRETGDCV